MRRLWWALCCVGAAVLLTGCSPSFLPQAQEISNVQLMRTIAVDDASEGQIKVTVSSGVQQEESGSKAPLILQQEAQTVFSACQAIQKNGNGHVSYGHVSECVVGKQAAEAGIDRVLDYIQRDFEMRLDTMIFLADQERAEDVVTKAVSHGMAVTDRLQEISRELPLKSQSWPCTVREFLVDEYDNGWAIMPMVKLQKEQDGYSISSSGVALFYKTKLVEELDTDTSRGACLLLNEGKVAYEDVKLKDGSMVGLKITEEGCHWKDEWKGDQLSALTAEVRVSADLAEVSGTVALEQEAVFQEIEQKLASAVTQKVKAALEMEKKYGDFLHLRRSLEVQNPGKVRLIQDQWDEWRKSIPFRVTTKAIVERSYDVDRGVEQS